MTQTPITALNGKARPKNPYMQNGEAGSFEGLLEWSAFESTVQWHDTDLEDGEYLGELVWQISTLIYEKHKWEWVDCEPDPEYKLFDKSKYQVIWRIVQQPQEKQSADNSTLDRLIKMVKEANYRNEQLIINLLEYNRK